jgi:chromosome segregation ATPase
MGAAVLVLALVASAAYGFTTNQSLERTNANLDTTAANLASTTDTLTSTQGELESTKTDLTTEADAHSQADASVERLNNQVSGLQSQLEARDACVTSLRADEAQLQKISREQTTQFNRGAKDSALVKADVAYTGALIEVADDYYNATTNAWDGSYSAANSWIAAGNSAASRATQALKTYNAEISKINAGTKKVEAEDVALSDSITKTLSLCNAAAGSS